MRLIDYDEFKWQLTHWYDSEGWSHDIGKMVYDLMELDDAMEKTPIVDPVRHGRWKVVGQPYMRKHFNPVCCSICKRRGYNTPYCAYCGAKMDEVDE